MLPYFVYNGINSKAMGVMVNSYPPIVRPKRRATTVTIPGRTGDLTYHEDEDTYDSYIRTCACTALPGADLDAISDWLDGERAVVFGNEPLYAYAASIVNQINYEKPGRGILHRTFDVPFLVQPYKMLATPGADIEKTASGEYIDNPGTLNARPVITIHCTGTADVIVGMYPFTLTGLSGAGVFRIDCDAEIVTDTGITQNHTWRMSGGFPRLTPGANAVSWTGTVSKIIIEPRYRWL
jgi:phage-related protein